MTVFVQYPTMEFIARYYAGRLYIKPLSENAKNLLMLMKKQHVEPNELFLITEIGFRLRFVGDMEELEKVLSSHKLQHLMVKDINHESY